MLDINELSFVSEPVNFDQTGTLYNIKIHDVERTDMIIVYDLNSHKSSIAVLVDDVWRDSSSTSDWPHLDNLFGRSQWQQFVRDHQEESFSSLSE